MNDRELLELAAKAAGVNVGARWSEETQTWFGDKETTNEFWNPLTDDGDALRLAVKLRLDVMFTPEDVEVIATQHADGDFVSPWACESWTLKNQDTYTATRRAIVRAAADVGLQANGEISGLRP